jgi:hypothetical protein
MKPSGTRGTVEPDACSTGMESATDAGCAAMDVDPVKIKPAASTRIKIAPRVKALLIRRRRFVWLT